MKYLFLISLFTISFYHTALSFDVGKLQGYSTSIYDETKILSQDDITSINSKIEEIRQKYTVEILLVIISTTDGQDISQLGVEIGQSVGVGKKDVDNGLVILVAVDDRAWNISTGYGVEGALPDIIVNRIGENNFPTHFRNGEYAQGFLGALDNIEGYIAKDPDVISKLSETNTLDQSIGFLMWYFFIAIFISAFLFQKDLKSGDLQNYGRKLFITYLITLPISYLLIGVYALIINFCIWLIASLVGNNNSSGGRGGSGGGGWSSGGGSSGGFGGGGFGGGGSSGRW